MVTAYADTAEGDAGGGACCLLIPIDDTGADFAEEALVVFFLVADYGGG